MLWHNSTLYRRPTRLDALSLPDSSWEVPTRFRPSEMNGTIYGIDEITYIHRSGSQRAVLDIIIEYRGIIVKMSIPLNAGKMVIMKKIAYYRPCQFGLRFSR